MKTLIKAILKFFKLSKLSFIGLFILIFFSMSIFTVLNSTNANLTSSYNTVATQGNLHNFVINENYRYGQGPYILNTSKDSINGDVNITNITKLGNTENNFTYSIDFEINTSLIQSGQDFEWSYSYLDVFNKFNDDKNSYFYKNFLSFQKIVTSQDDVTLDNWTTKNNFVTTVTSVISQNNSDLVNYVETFYQQEFIDEVSSKTNTEIRSFNSININNTQQNIFFKLIESSPEYTIDKIVLYSGSNLELPANFDDVNKILLATQQELSNNPELSRSLVKYLYKASWSNQSFSFDALYNYVYNNLDYNPYSNSPEVSDEARDEIIKESNILKYIIDTKGIINDGFQIRFSYSISGIAPVSGKIEDFTSYGAIISPQYLDKLHKSPINFDEWTNHLDDKQERFEQWISTLFDNTFQIDNQTFVILGTGVSPDFMYPVVSFSNVVPNNETEQIVYTNSAGFAKMENSFRGNEQENFLVGKFETSSSYNQEILDEINSISRNYMAWPSNVNAAYMYDDTSNTLSPSALRVVFIPEIVKTIWTVSRFLTAFILLLSIFISIVIIKRCIESNRNSLGIMQANGYKKWEIILGICLLIWIPVFASAFFGYILGLSLQTLVINLLGSFWTLPTSIEGFSIGLIIGIVLTVSAIFLALTIIFSWFCLRGETSEFMKDESKYKMTKIASLLKKPFTKFSVITRLRAAIAFSSLWRLILLSLMSALLMTSLTFSINTLNSFSSAAEKTYSTRKYTYALNLVTPTLQSGQYYTVPYQQQGKTLNKLSYFDTSLAYSYQDIEGISNDDFIDQKYWEEGDYSKYVSTNSDFQTNLKIFGNYQLVSQDDLTNQKSDIFYLKNKTTTKPFTDINLGLGSITSNPWTLASQLMPSNNSTYANQAFVNMFENAAKDTTNTLTINNQNLSIFEVIRSFSKAYVVLKNETETSTNITPKFNDQNYFGAGIYQTTLDEIKNSNSVFYDTLDSLEDPNFDYYLEFDISKIGGNFDSPIVTDVNINFLNLLYYLYSQQQLSNYTYSINYNKLVANQSDKPYTYIGFLINDINGSTIRSSSDSLVVTGLSKDQNATVDLYNSNNKLLNNELWNYPLQTIKNNNEEIDVYPIVINEYASKKYGINRNDVIKAEITNSADRYSRKYFNIENPIAYFKVMDIITTYQGADFYINQYDANKILGLTINNVKPKVPTDASQITSVVSWSQLEWDYGNAYEVQTKQNEPSEIENKNQFDNSKSGFNGIFSVESNSLVEVTNGVSLYSVSGLYPGTDLISTTDSTINALFANKDNLIKAIKLLGFNDLLDANGNPTVDASAFIQTIADIFGSSSSLFIVSNASSNSSTIDILNSTSSTLSKIQDAIMTIVVLITILIIVIVSSLIINDSLKLAAILKCLGLDDKKNAGSFLSVYVPVFLLGLLLSIPLTFLLGFIYTNFVFGFAGILIIIDYSWWHFVVSSIGIIFIFFLSYWTTWNKIGKMNLAMSIK